MEGIDGSYVGGRGGGEEERHGKGNEFVGRRSGGRFERGGEEEEKEEVQIVGIKLGGQCQWMTEISTAQFYQLLILRTENA